MSAAALRNTTTSACRQRCGSCFVQYCVQFEICLTASAGRSLENARWRLNKAVQGIDIKSLSMAAPRPREAPPGVNFFAPFERFRCYIQAPAREFSHALHKAKKVTRVFEFESSMLKTHKFQIGQTVCFTSRPVGHMAVNDIYRIVKLLPSDGEDYQYRIKSANEAFERVAKESQLDRY
jgi:hypothetical protein